MTFLWGSERVCRAKAITETDSWQNLVAGMLAVIMILPPSHSPSVKSVAGNEGGLVRMRGAKQGYGADCLRPLAYCTYISMDSENDTSSTVKRPDSIDGSVFLPVFFVANVFEKGVEHG